MSYLVLPDLVVSIVPKPLQVGHIPEGLLKEKSLGVGGSILIWQAEQVRFLLKNISSVDCCDPSTTLRIKFPVPILRAALTELANVLISASELGDQPQFLCYYADVCQQ